MKSYINFLLIILLISSCTNSNYTVFNFKTNINLKNLNDDNYMKIKFDQTIYTEVKFGDPNQIIPMTIKTWQYPTFIVSNEATEDIKIKFYPLNSHTFRKEYDNLITGLYTYDFTKGYLSRETMNISSTVNNFMFMLATELNVGIKNISGEIGLAKENTEKDQLLPQKAHFIDQLLENNIIYKKIFGFTYDSEYEGRLIFGAYLYEVEPNYKEKDMNEFDIDTDVSDENNNKWMMKFFFQCTSGEDNKIIYEEKTYGFFFIESDLIIGSTVFQKNFVKEYFAKRNCQSETVQASAHFTVYYCTEESQFSDFPNITLKYPGKYNFTFTKNELFVKRGNKYIFQIVFLIFTDDVIVPSWKIGQIFFRKYSVFFKQEDRGYKMSYYLTQKFKKSSSLSTQTIVIIILSIILGLLIIGIIVYFVYFFPKRKKKRANELVDDNYEYKAEEKETTEGKNDKLMINE